MRGICIKYSWRCSALVCAFSPFALAFTFAFATLLCSSSSAMLIFIYISPLINSICSWMSFDVLYTGLMFAIAYFILSFMCYDPFSTFSRVLCLSLNSDREHTANHERSEKRERERKRGEEKTAHRAHTQCCGFILYNVYYATLYLPLSFTLFVVDMGFGYVYLLHVYTDVCLG